MRIGRPRKDRISNPSALQAIRSFAEETERTLREVAEIMGVSSATLRTWLSRSLPPTVESWERFERFTGQLKDIKRRIPLRMIGLCKYRKDDGSTCFESFVKTSPRRKFCDDHLTNKRRKKDDL